MPARAGRFEHVPEIEYADRATAGASKRLADVEYVGKMEAVVFRFGDGRILGLPIGDLDGLDDSPVTRVLVNHDGCEVTVEQFSGNRLVLLCDRLRSHLDPIHR